MKEGDNGGSGAPGGAGVAGDDGAAAGKVVLRIGEVSGKGRLIVDLSGQGGGKGQDGGQGGDGGNGRNGSARVCGGDEPQDGGDGGWGGIGGQGGQGGRGGNGGIVVYSAALTPLIKSKHFVAHDHGGRIRRRWQSGPARQPGQWRPRRRGRDRHAAPAAAMANRAAAPRVRSPARPDRPAPPAPRCEEQAP